MMSPDIDSLTSYKTDGYANNGVDRDAAYQIPDIVLNSPATRKLRVLSIGAGVSGIMNAYKIQKHCENVEHVIYEKNEDIGGTWLENRYPGCGCDIPSHAYTYNFALNPDWPRFFSYSKDIFAYLDKVCDCFGLRKYMTFNTEVVGCYWQQEKGEWLVKLNQTSPDGSVREFDDTCNLLLHGAGILNNFKWPNIEGMEKFNGRIIHTARWPKDYQAEEWKNDRVAVIGSGASSIQTVPTMQPHVKHMDIFIRTGVWFVQIANNYGQNYEYTAEQKEIFRHDTDELVKHAKDIEDQVNGLWGAFYKNSEAGKMAREMFTTRMREFIKDDRLLKGFTPKFSLGCRRITPGDPYMIAIQNPNVDVHFTPVTRITEHTIIGADGTSKEIDTIICATGFDTTYRPRFPIIGLNGVSLAEKWKICPEAYLGLAIPSIPNFLTFIGPNWPVENGSVMGPLSVCSDYAIQAIKKMQAENILSWAPKQDVTDAYNVHVQEWMRHTVWVEECRSWYKDNETGRVNAVWPGSSLHYCDMIERVRWEDFEITYGRYGGDGEGEGEGKEGGERANMWAFMGMGTTVGSVLKRDPSPYLQRENVDPRWLEAVRWDERLKTGKRVGKAEDGAPTGQVVREGNAQTAE